VDPSHSARTGWNLVGIWSEWVRVRVKFGWVFTDMSFQPNSNQSDHSARIRSDCVGECKVLIEKKKNGIPCCLYPQPSAQGIHTHHSWSMHRHIANIPCQCQAGKLQSGLRLCFISVHSDAIDNQWPILIICKVSNWDITGKWRTDLPIHLTNLFFNTWVLNVLYWVYSLRFRALQEIVSDGRGLEN